MSDPVRVLHALTDDEALMLRRRLDSFGNWKTGIGGSFDKRQGGFAIIRANDYQHWMDLYRANDMAARIVDALPEDMVRKGWRVAIEGGKDTSEEVDMTLDDLEARKHFEQALKWERAAGGAGIFIGANDGQTADVPLNEDKIRNIDFLLPLDTLELVPNSYYVNPLEPKYGLPETYRLNRFGTISPVPPRFGGKPQTGGLSMLTGGPSMQGGALSKLALSAGDWNFLPIVHETRILRFGGVFVNRLQLRANRYWGDPILLRCEEVLRDFGLSWASVGILLQDFAQAVIKMKGMAALVAKSGPKAFADAAAMVESSRSTANALILDAEDTFERSRTPMEGLPNLLDRIANRLAATADMPVTRLMGIAPSGLNSDDQSGQAWWYDKVEAQQVSRLRPPLNRLVTLLFKAKKGPTSGTDPGRGNWSVQFHPLLPLNPKEEAERRYIVAQADQIYVNMPGGLTGEEVIATRFGGDDYSADKIDLDETDPMKRALSAAELAEVRSPVPEEGAEPGQEPEPTDAGQPKKEPGKKT